MRVGEKDKVAVIAKGLIRSGALKFGRFTLKSGVISPYYIDLTWLLSSPKDFTKVTGVIAHEISRIASERKIDKLATIELKGALLLPHIASFLKLPCIIVRKEAKTYGLTGRVVGGEIKSGERFIFFDDVITDGKSKIEGIKPIEEFGGEIDTIIVVVDREHGGRERLERIGYRVEPLVTISEVVNKLLELGEMPREKAEKIIDYVRKVKKGELKR